MLYSFVGCEKDRKKVYNKAIGNNNYKKKRTKVNVMLLGGNSKDNISFTLE